MTEGDNGSGEAGSEGGGSGGAMNLSASSRPSSAPAPAQNGDGSGPAGMEVDLGDNRVSPLYTERARRKLLNPLNSAIYVHNRLLIPTIHTFLIGTFWSSE